MAQPRLALIDEAGSFLEARHLRGDPDHYARNLIHDAPDSGLSLYASGCRGSVSLHLYGRTMNRFNICDAAAGTRRAIDVAHNES